MIRLRLLTESSDRYEPEVHLYSSFIQFFCEFRSVDQIRNNFLQNLLGVFIMASGGHLSRRPPSGKSIWEQGGIRILVEKACS